MIRPDMVSRWTPLTLDTTGGWSLYGSCRDGNPDALFVSGIRAQRQAKRVCVGCPVQTVCLAYALDNRVEWGVWGGLTEAERRAVLRRHPRVASWRRALQVGRNAGTRRVSATRRPAAREATQ